MPVFQYNTRRADGQPDQGTVEAADRERLVATLRASGLLVIDVAPVQAESGKSFLESLSPRSWLPPAKFDVEIGLEQLATMLHNGLGILEALKIVSEQSRRKRMARVWRDIGERIEEGATFSVALTAHTNLFSSYIIQLVRVGEQSGTLDVVLSRGAEHLSRSRELRLMVLNALTYPALVAVMALGVAAFMVIKVIPKVTRFLESGGKTLPALTQRLVDISEWLRLYLPQVSVGLLAITLALIGIYHWPPGKKRLDGVLLRTPVVGGVLRLSGTAVFARGLGILLQNGLTLLESLSTVEQLVGNLRLSGRIAESREAVIRGDSLAHALMARQDFLPMLPRMVAVGESTGALSSVLLEVAGFHEKQLMQVIRRLGSLMEPLLVLVVGGLVGFVYVAFFVAVFSLAGSVR
jgi:type II secretory pathway component PulF